MTRSPIAHLIARAAAALIALVLGMLALPAAAKNMFYVRDQLFDQSVTSVHLNAAWYLTLGAEGKARLTGALGSQTGVYTDNGTETLVTLTKPLAYTTVSAPDEICGNEQHVIGIEVAQVLFRRVPGTNASKGKSQVVEIGRIDDPGNACKPPGSTPFGSLSDAGITMSHRSSAKRESMADVTAGLAIAGFSEAPWPSPSGPSASVLIEADIVTFESATALRFQRSGRLVDAAFNGDGWLVLNLPGFQRAFTRFSLNTATGAEVWFMADWRDGKPQAAVSVLMFKPLPGASFGTKAQTSRMWEIYLSAGTNNPFFFYLYGNYQGDRVSKDIAAATESRVPFNWRFDGADVFMSRMIGATLSERRWTPLGRVGKNMWVLEQEWRTLSGQAPYAFIPARVMYFIDRGAAAPPAP